MAPILTIDAADGPRAQERHDKQRRLRELTHWYQEFADRAGNPVIWEAFLAPRWGGRRHQRERYFERLRGEFVTWQNNRILRLINELKLP
jgi:hypothetical protein